MSKIRSHEHRLLINLVKAYRINAGLRQVDLAAALGVPQSMISKLEAGERRLDVQELGKICAALKISMTEFVAQYEKDVAEPHEAN